MTFERAGIVGAEHLAQACMHSIRRQAPAAAAAGVELPARATWLVQAGGGRRLGLHRSQQFSLC